MQRPKFQKFCFGFIFMGWKQKLQISFSRKNGKGSESKPGNFMKNEKDWFMRTLGCQLSLSPDIFLVGWPLRCLEGMGAVFTSHFPLCSFRQWEPSGLKQKSSSPLLVILLFRGFYESSISWLRWAKLIWLSVTTWQHQFIVFIPLPSRSWLNFWRSSRTNSICEVAGCEGSTILSSSSFYFYNPTFTSAGPEASIPISLKALGAASNL